VKEFKDMLAKSDRVFLGQHDVCKKAGLLTKENTKDKKVPSDAFKVPGADGN
jgi:hypothetical protein